MYEREGFLLADLHDGSPSTLDDAVQRPWSLRDEVARGGWSCRFYCRISPADVYYLERRLDLVLAEVPAEEGLLAVALDFRPEIALYLFAADADGLCEIVLMPYEGATIDAEAVTKAALEVLFGVVAVVGWNPFAELDRFAS